MDNNAVSAASHTVDEAVDRYFSMTTAERQSFVDRFLADPDDDLHLMAAVVDSLLRHIP